MCAIKATIAAIRLVIFLIDSSYYGFDATSFESQLANCQLRFDIGQHILDQGVPFSAPHEYTA